MSGDPAHRGPGAPLGCGLAGMREFGRRRGGMTPRNPTGTETGEERRHHKVYSHDDSNTIPDTETGTEQRLGEVLPLIQARLCETPTERGFVEALIVLATHELAGRPAGPVKITNQQLQDCIADRFERESLNPKVIEDMKRRYIGRPGRPASRLELLREVSQGTPARSGKAARDRRNTSLSISRRCWPWAPRRRRSGPDESPGLSAFLSRRADGAGADGLYGPTEEIEWVGRPKRRLALRGSSQAMPGPFWGTTRPRAIWPEELGRPDLGVRTAETVIGGMNTRGLLTPVRRRG